MTEALARNASLVGAHPQQADGPKPPRRFEPVLIETTMTTNRRTRPAPINTSSTPSVKMVRAIDEAKTSAASATESGNSKRRRSRDKFAEEWEDWGNKAAQDFGKRRNDTAKGTENKKTARFRRGSDDASPISPTTTPVTDGRGHSPLFLEIERATSPLTRRRPSWASLRSHHSFKVPELDPIESSESEPSSPFSSPMTLSATTTHTNFCKSEMTPVAEVETADDRYSDYLLKLAADTAEKKLRDQAMAAYPNDDHHERIDHYVDREESPVPDLLSPAETPAEERGARRESYFPETNWGVVDMQRHHEKLEEEKEAKRQKQKLLAAKLDWLAAQEDQHDPWSWQYPENTRNPYHDMLGGPTDDEELGAMRNSASPPLLGDDIVFPRCQSPEPAHFDPTQGCDAVKMAQNYLSEQSQHAERGEGLWCGSNMPSTRPSLYSVTPSAVTSRSPSPSRGLRGLWSGSCLTNGRSSPRGPTGLLTPEQRVDNPPSPAPSPIKNVLPPTPPPSNPDMACIDQKLAAEAAIEEEFSDTFVTQVYNYLSLGYPAIGRLFDEELSKISHIPISELRQDDHLPSARGYIRLGEDRSPADNITEETCMRWRALRSYIKVWARQHPNMATAEKEPVGVAARRGSWGQ